MSVIIPRMTILVESVNKAMTPSQPAVLAHNKAPDFSNSKRYVVRDDRI